VLNITKGALLQGNAEQNIARFSTDSRKVIDAAGSLFVALVTPTNDGHNYVNDAYAKGVRSFLVSKELRLPEDALVIQVEDTLQALQELAAAHRVKFNFPVIGITGSNGKTIVKEWLFQLLHEEFNIVRSPKSYNSQVGVPLSLSLMEDFHTLAIIEAGISQPGEMSRLAKMIEPTIGILTNLKEAHSEGFESNAQKLQEKIKLFSYVDTIIFDGNYQAILQSIEEKFPEKELKYWSKEDRGELRQVEWSVSEGKTSISGVYKGQSLKISIPFDDEASIENAIHAWLMALELGMSPDKVAAKMMSLQSVEMRLSMVHGRNGSILISDYYNSDPSSLRIALNSLNNQRVSGEKIVVLSAFEQIEGSAEFYDKMFELIHSYQLDEMYLVGSEWKGFEGRSNTTWFSNVQELLLHFSNKRIDGSAILIKGARRYALEKLADALTDKKHETFLEVNLEAMVHNLNYFKSLLPKTTKVMAMVKAFSYGSGSSEVASLLQFHDVDYLGVAYIEEGVALRNSGINLPIMVMNPSIDGMTKLLKYQLEPEIYSLDLLSAFLDVIEQEQDPKARFSIHIKIDTGMHRLGLSKEDVELLPVMLHRDARVEVKSGFTHLAGADEMQFDEFSKEQLDLFEGIINRLERDLGYAIIKHALNSAGVVRFPERAMDMVRLGIGLYGIDSSQTIQKKLQPVSRFITHVSQVKMVLAGQSVGYSRGFIAKNDTKIATLPVGYADGYFRALGKGKAEVLINGQRCKVIGNVCMDMLMVDVTHLEVEKGDEVELFGNQITVNELAQIAETIPYEMLVHISSRVPRVYLHA
jgi:alanine racemase